MKPFCSSDRHTHPVSVVKAEGQQSASTLLPTRYMISLSFAAADGRGDAPFRSGVGSFAAGAVLGGLMGGRHRGGGDGFGGGGGGWGGGGGGFSGGGASGDW
jgi:uncharacterized membrane protein YgcG